MKFLVPPGAARGALKPAILERLHGVQRAGGGWLAFCPAHNDQKKRSLSVGLTEDGKTLLKCHAAGCMAEQITRAVSMSLADLAGTNGHHRPERRREIATYDYRSERGELLYQVVRFEPKDFRPRRPDGHGGWKWNLQDVRRVVYQLPELAESRRVFLVEGEKDADRLCAIDMRATTTPSGVESWRDEYAQQIRDAGVEEIVACRDNDAPGLRYVRHAAASLTRVGIAVRMLDLPGLPPKGDVSDWLDAGHTAVELMTLADAAPHFHPDPSPPGTSTGLVDADGPVLVRLDSVAPMAVSWHWAQRIARGKLTLVIGEPAAGKSTAVDDVAARTTQGAGWPDGGVAPPGDVVMLTAEDGLADTVRPRIDRQGGDPTRVHVLRAVRIAGAECPLNLERDLPALETALATTSAVLLIISPLSSYLGSRDSYKDAEVRAILDPLATLAERRNVAVVGIMHLTKNQQRSLLNRAQGNVAFVAVARIVLAVGKDPAQPGRRLLASVKNNLGPDAAALAFRISDAGLIWEEAPVVGTADRLLVGDEAPTRTENRERDTATQFLRDLLSDGPVASKQVEGDAKANGIAQRTLWRAKSDLGILADRARTYDGRTSGWYWRLPEPAL